jgi:hypothetical protein
MKMLTLVVSLWICTVHSALGADFNIIKGKISSFNREPLAGATLIITLNDRTIGGVASGLDGSYSIRVSDTHDEPLTIKVSSIGYEEKLVHFLPTFDTSIVNFILGEKPIDYGTIIVSPRPRKTELM